jgi:cellulose synthase/poly-beta-1,6-N-acetylglucosamine synthase-like glycosyltransferase
LQKQLFTMSLIAVIIFLLLCTFFFLMVYISIMTLTCPKKFNTSSAKSETGISIVIPFFNEAPRLSGLIESLLQQDYKGPFEIVLVNDGSQDDYLDGIASFMKSAMRPIKLLNNKFDEEKKLTSKQQAIDAGVAHASYDYIVFSDADMEFENGWLSSLAAMIPGGYDLVFGRTKVKKVKKGILEFFQAYQLEFLFAVSYGFHVAKISGSCMGNNLLVRKNAYLAIGQQAGIGYSIVEDRALYMKFKRNNMKITPTIPFYAQAKTFACENFGDFYHQALRWARGGFSESFDLLPMALLFTLQGTFLFLSICGFMAPAITMVSFFNLGIVIFFIFCVFKKIDSKENAFFFPVYFGFLAVEFIVFICSFAITPVISWKNKRL